MLFLESCLSKIDPTQAETPESLLRGAGAVFFASRLVHLVKAKQLSQELAAKRCSQGYIITRLTKKKIDSLSPYSLAIASRVRDSE